MVSDPPVAQRLLLLLASFVAAVLSWRYVETPFRKRAVLKSRAQILSAGGITLSTLMLAGLAIHLGHGFPSRESPEALAYGPGNTKVGWQADLGVKEAENQNFIELGPADKHLPIKLFVWGDSHAMVTLSILDALCKEHHVRGLAATHSSTAPLLGFESEGPHSLKQDSIPYNNAVVSFIQAKHVGDVILPAMWGYYGSNTSELHRCLLETIAALKASGARIWIMRQVPRPGWNVPRVLASALMFGDRNPENLVFPLADYHQDSLIQNQIFKGIAPPDVTFLDPTKFFFKPDNQLLVVEGDKCLYFDDHHLSVAGAAKLRPLFEPIFTKMAENK